MTTNYPQQLSKLGWRVIPILPRFGVFLKIGPDTLREYAEMGAKLPHEPGDGFARLFKTVWRKLPLAVRRSLRSYWRAGPGKISVELTNFRMKEDGLLGACADGGFTLRFVPNVELLPKGTQLHLIAHELGHAFLWTSNVEQTCFVDVEISRIAKKRRATMKGVKEPNLTSNDYKETESRVDALAEAWGFPRPTKRKAK